MYASETLRLAGDRQGIIFCPGVKTAHVTAAKLNALKPHSAAVVDGKTPKPERERIIHQFRAGRIQYLSNCQVATEGFDAPSASVIVMARPTKSQSLYAQMVGRGTRTLPGVVDTLHDKDEAGERRARITVSGKPDCLVLDFVGNCRHKLVNVTDVLGGNYTDKEVETAKKMAKKAGGGDALAYLKGARALLKRVAEASKAKVSSQVRDFDPFRVLNLQRDEDQDRHTARFGHQPLTPRQREVLEKMKVPPDVTSKMGRRDFTRLMKAVSKRRQLGLATYRQLAVLQRYGVQEINVSFKGASKAMDLLAKRGWRRGAISPEELKGILRSGRGPVRNPPPRNPSSLAQLQRVDPRFRGRGKDSS